MDVVHFSLNLPQASYLLGMTKQKPLAGARGFCSFSGRDYLPPMVIPPGVCWFFFSSFALRVVMVLSRH